MVIEKLSLVLLLLCFSLLTAIFLLIRKDRLKTQHALLFILLTIPLIPFSVSKKLQTIVATMLGIHYPPTAFFLVGFAFIIIILLYFMVTISQLSTQNKILAREIALLNSKIDSLFSRQKN
ncbi:DUF2304 domain-containing protein [Candidatus Margulisiibacteriota bacterium]